MRRVRPTLFWRYFLDSIKINEPGHGWKDAAEKIISKCWIDTLDTLDNLLNTNYHNNIDPVIILQGENWHEGVIGIIAARVKEKFNKPAIIISTISGIGKGSARSIYGFDIGSVILSAVQEGLLVRGGGHKMAAGFTINAEKIELLKEFVFRKFKSININFEDKKKYFFDTEIAPSAVNLSFYEKVNLLSPFGSGNTEPRFLIQNLKIVNSKIVGEQHIKSVLIGPDSSSIKTISFNSVDTELSTYLLKKNTKSINIVGKLSLNEWRGQKNVEFIIDDISVIK